MSTRAISWMFIWAATTGAPAWAGQWLQACESAIKDSQQQCEQAYQSYKSSDASRLASGMASSTNDTHNNAINLKGKIDAAKAELDKDIAQCQSAKQSCESKCEQQKNAAQPEAQKQPPNPSAVSDIQQIPPKKDSECSAKIQSKISEMQAGRAPLDSQSNQANNTKDQSQSGGGAPQMPQSQSGDKSSDSGTTAGSTTAQTANASLNCAVGGASRFSDCNTQFVAKCTSSMAATECDSFSDRYCNLTSATGTPALATATTNLVIDKRGEGLGSQYCGLANAYRYCQTPGRESCPSCIKVYAQSSCQGVGCIAQTSTSVSAAKKPNCQDDPSYLTPGSGSFGITNPVAVAQLTGGGSSGATTGSSASGLAYTGSGSGYLAPASLSGMSTASAGRGGSDSGGGGGGLGSGGGQAAAGGAGSNREDTAGQIIGSADVAGGGGGGGGSGGDSPWIAGEERDLASLDVMKAFDGKKNEPANAVAGVAADVSNAYGPSIFSIGSGAIHGFCVRGRIPNCN